MYSTKFDSELRYVVTCITNQTAVRVVETIVDTGAKYTCYRASFIDDRLKEDDMKNNASINIGGFIKGCLFNKDIHKDTHKDTREALSHREVLFH